MGDINDGGPAFPMSLRDWFAGQALAGYLSNSIVLDAFEPGENLIPTLAKASYEHADAMLKARERADG